MKLTVGQTLPLYVDAYASPTPKPKKNTGLSIQISDEAVAGLIARGKRVMPQERQMLSCTNPNLLQKADEANLIRIRLKANLHRCKDKFERDGVINMAVSSLMPPPGSGNLWDTESALLRMAAIRAAQQPDAK